MTHFAVLRAVSTYVPETTLTNEQLADFFPEWTPDKILSKTGISSRGIAPDTICASDLGILAAKKLFDTGICKPKDIDFLLFCTQAPDYPLPSTACLMQSRLEIPTSCGALDYNLGCSGFVYGLALAKSLIESLDLRNVLLITADTYSKYIHPEDKSIRTLFGDGAAATLISASETAAPTLGPFIFGTDGKGADHLIVPGGGARFPGETPLPEAYANADNVERTSHHLRMNGGEVFNFTIQTIPDAVSELLKKANLTLEDIDAFVFHQANKFMLDHLRKKLHIPQEKFIINMENYGNTVSSTIPMALKKALSDDILNPPQRIMLIGFGVGYSWAGTILTLSEKIIHV